MLKRWDIFCRVIDNLGDAGVCWRLARQLVSEHGREVRLWIDTLEPLALLCPTVNSALETQTVEGVTISCWPPEFPETRPADVVIEAFACTLPENYRAHMRAKPPVWINLEYLTAESWIDDCHGLPSTDPATGLVKYFFFPGYSTRSGGLIREKELIFPAQRVSEMQRSTLKCSLFCYDTAPVARLFDHLVHENLHPVEFLVPPGKPLALVQDYLGTLGDFWQSGGLTVRTLPFVPQADFDALLGRCDINFVRGEDSFVRAQWVGKPMVWQIYPTEDHAHWNKLDAFLERYLSGTSDRLRDAVRRLFYAWNGRGDIVVAWQGWLEALEDLQTHAILWRDLQMERPDLVTGLVKFCESKV